MPSVNYTLPLSDLGIIVFSLQLVNDIVFWRTFYFNLSIYLANTLSHKKLILRKKSPNLNQRSYWNLYKLWYFSVFYISVFISSLLRVSEGAMAGLQCYIGNCTSMEACRRPELVTDCPHDQAYDACLSIIVQKGRLLKKWSLIHLFKRLLSFFPHTNWQFTHKILYQHPALLTVYQVCWSDYC